MSLIKSHKTSLDFQLVFLPLNPNNQHQVIPWLCHSNIPIYSHPWPQEFPVPGWERHIWNPEQCLVLPAPGISCRTQKTKGNNSCTGTLAHPRRNFRVKPGKTVGISWFGAARLRRGLNSSIFLQREQLKFRGITWKSFPIPSWLSLEKSIP